MSAPPKETEWARRQRRNQERAEHVAAHGPACQICGNEPKRGLDQDHDHRSGLTRGWLCHRCNRALPTWITALWLAKASRYLVAGTGGDTAEARMHLEAAIHLLSGRKSMSATDTLAP